VKKEHRIRPRFNLIEFWGGVVAPKITQSDDMFFPIESSRITNNILVIKDDDVNVFIYTDGKNTVCIDCGFKNNPSLERELKSLNINPDSISHLFLTHTDMDHAGGVSFYSNVQLFNDARLYLGRDEEQMIDGSTPRKWFLRGPVKIQREYELIDDGDVVEVGKIRVKAIATPGHTPGHMAFLINDHALFCGDALVLKDGKVKPFYSFWNMDNELDIRSVRKLAKLRNISVLLTSHTRHTFEFAKAMEEWL
jgi:glyoxylase-like metal-dependent hydrolase (beta-lactamase superfamily II)